MSFKAKQKRQVYLLELFPSEEQENFLLCSQRQYKLSEKVTTTEENIYISYASKCTQTNNECKKITVTKMSFNSLL